MGDINAVEEKCDRSTRTERNEASIVNKALIDLTNGLKLHDLWRKLKGNEKGHTFFFTRKDRQGLRNFTQMKYWSIEQKISRLGMLTSVTTV